jgi:hypothetical protein
MKYLRLASTPRISKLTSTQGIEPHSPTTL